MKSCKKGSTKWVDMISNGQKHEGRFQRCKGKDGAKNPLPCPLTAQGSPSNCPTEGNSQGRLKATASI